MAWVRFLSIDCLVFLVFAAVSGKAATLGGDELRRTVWHKQLYRFTIRPEIILTVRLALAR
jgi:hypothetical protein